MALRRLTVVPGEYFPAYVAWELTLRCNQPCGHCQSRAGKARPDELGTAEALGVVEQIRAMGAREVGLLGGEAYLHEGFLEIVAALAAAGIRPTLTTGGRGITAELARSMRGAGLHTASVSVDGLERAHDEIRGAPGSFAAATEALGHLREAGVLIGSNTTLNRVNLPDLEGLYEALRGLRIQTWQVQITAAIGRAADRPQMLLQPYDLLDLVPRVAALKRRAHGEGVRILPGNNLGYFGPEEALLRSFELGGRDHWLGCQAGRLLAGIESGGNVKGCPSLPSAAYVGGSLRDRPLAALWEESPQLAFARKRTVDDLWGFCRTCPFAEVCLGGCSFTAHSLFGRTGNNPYCSFRARTLAAENKRERLVPTRAASGKPFDHGLFEIVVEDLDAPEPPAPEGPGALVQVRRKPVAETPQSGVTGGS